MKIVFFGTPEYILPIVGAIHKAFKTKEGKSPVSSIVTQKPKPVGRKKVLTYSPIDSWAHKKKIPIFYKSEDIVKNNVEADLGILAAYGEIIPQSVISHFKFGIVNIHPSLLPKYRGASPVQASIVSGDSQTGVTIIKLDEKLDHGPIISQFSEEVLPDDTTASLRARLFERASEVLVTLIPAYLAGKITLRNQEDNAATFTTQIIKAHGLIPPEYIAATLQGQSFKGRWKIPFIKNYTLTPNPYSLEHFIRAMDPWPGAWTLLRLSSSGQAKRLKILKAHVEEVPKKSSVISHQLVLEEVQLEGKNPVSWKQLKEGYASVMFE